GEQCDDGNSIDGDGCSAICELEFCGDGTLQEPEQCDDGNMEDNDGCSAVCLMEFCGDNVTQSDEQCDDGNTVNNDGCSAACSLEFCGDNVTQNSEQCDDGNTQGGDGCSSTCFLEFCGDGTIQAVEQCDDGNSENNDGCNSACLLEFCGDSVAQSNEECDDGNTNNGDGCNSVCELEFCGDGVVQEPEQCDDGNGIGGDGCSASCQIEFCGDGILQGTEKCDDGNTQEGDGCSAVCEIEPPSLNKTVGDPKAIWEGDNMFYPNLTGRCWAGGEGRLDCWKVTLDTPITLTCEYPVAEPNGNETLCFEVELDGDIATEGYCDKTGGTIGEDGFCCFPREELPLTLYFMEESQHNLEFYCTDSMGNRTAIDEEKFKVNGRSFKINLNKKWNLISVPFVIQDDSPGAVFSGLEEEIIAVWTYDGVSKGWFVFTPDGVDNDNLDSIVPGMGYWVLANDSAMLLVGGSLLTEGPAAPPVKGIGEGWNLIGYYGNENGTITAYDGPDGEGREAICALGSLVDTAFGHPKWNSLLTYWEPDNPDQWTGLDQTDRMDPGAGYWLEIGENESYALSTTCPIGI
ncbi:MAG: DUF4215 domain-containing protein, partial [Candidatus Aenigmarchaeota archaeon]|nr:DUF4215 domain-containing protein [Candidatus Aenigmarchaeota archaeon]